MSNWKKEGNAIHSFSTDSLQIKKVPLFQKSERYSHIVLGGTRILRKCETIASHGVCWNLEYHLLSRIIKLLLVYSKSKYSIYHVSKRLGLYRFTLMPSLEKDIKQYKQDKYIFTNNKTIYNIWKYVLENHNECIPYCFSQIY